MSCRPRGPEPSPRPLGSTGFERSFDPVSVTRRVPEACEPGVVHLDVSLDEAVRRDAELDSGTARAVPADEVFAAARARLR